MPLGAFATCRQPVVGQASCLPARASSPCLACGQDALRRQAGSLPHFPPASPERAHRRSERSIRLAMLSANLVNKPCLSCTANLHYQSGSPWPWLFLVAGPSRRLRLKRLTPPANSASIGISRWGERVAWREDGSFSLPSR